MSLARIGYGLVGLAGDRSLKERLEECELEVGGTLLDVIRLALKEGHLDQADDDLWVARALTTRIDGVGILELAAQADREEQVSPTWRRFRRRMQDVLFAPVANLDPDDRESWPKVARAALYAALYSCERADLTGAYEELARARGLLLMRRKYRSKKGGRTSKKKKQDWAIGVAEFLAIQHRGCRFEEIWRTLPTDSEEALEVELLECSLGVYRTCGERDEVLVADDRGRMTFVPSVEMPKATFRRHYLGPVLRGG